MNKFQKKNLLIFSLILLVIFLFAYFAYGQYKQRVEEGLVYISLFEPNPYIKDFEQVVVFSSPSTCGATSKNLFQYFSRKTQVESFQQDVFSNFFKLNAEGANPIKLSILEGRVPIISWKDTKKIHKKGIETFLNPEGLRVIYLSRVGFNKKRNKAVACVEYQGYHFNRNIIYFEKINNKWSFAEL